MALPVSVQRFSKRLLSSFTQGTRFFSEPVHSKDVNDKTFSDKVTGTTVTDKGGVNTIIKLSSHLELHKASNTSSGSASATKPLVLLCEWLYAKPEHVNKYCELYHDLGLDVLTVRGKLSHFLWPPQGLNLAHELFVYLKKNRPPNEKLFIHSFSIGSYNYTIAMEAAHKNPEECGHFRDRVVGQIFDSVVIGSYENMSKGIAQILPNNKVFRQIVIQTLGFYYNITSKNTQETYNQLVQHFREDPIHVPTLFFFSENDPLCDVATMKAMLKDWRSERSTFDVTSVSWPKSQHAAHLREHREEYLAAWRALMKKLQLTEAADKS